MKVASNLVGVQLSSLTQIFNKQALKKAMEFHSDYAHTFNTEYKLIASVLHLSAPITMKSKYKNIFVLIFIQALNVRGRTR